MNAAARARGLVAHPVDREGILRLLPQRPPLLLVAEVLATRPGPAPAILAALDVRGDEPVLAGHFPGQPIWPGSYTIEGLAQTAALAAALAGTGPAPLVLLVAVKVKLLDPIRPPARLEYFAELTAEVGGLYRFDVQAVVAGRQVAAGTLDVAVRSPGRG